MQNHHLRFVLCIVTVKSTVEILQNFVAFSKYMNFIIYSNKVWNQKFLSQKRLATVQRNAYSFGTSLGLKPQKFLVFLLVYLLARCTRSLCTKVMRVRSVTICYHFFQNTLLCISSFAALSDQKSIFLG